MDDLFSRLLCRTKGQRLSARSVSGLFRELALCGGERRLAFANQTFWYRPRSQVSGAPERASGMAEQNLNTASCTAVEQKSRASFIWCSFSHFRTLFEQ
jgi:hypothetical protein